MKAPIVAAEDALRELASPRVAYESPVDGAAMSGATRVSVIRLVGAVLCEQHEEWIAAERRYLSLGTLNLARRLIEPHADVRARHATPRNSPVAESTTLASIDRAWTSSPTHVSGRVNASAQAANSSLSWSSRRS